MNDEELLRRIKIKAEGLNDLLKTADLLGLSVTITMANRSLKSCDSAVYKVQVYGTRAYNINY